MKPQKGFIQIPILITIIVGILVIGGGGYFGYNQFKNYQHQQAEKEKQAQELIDEQQKALEEAQKAIEESKKLTGEIKSESQEKDEEISGLQKEVETEKSKPADLTIRASEIESYLLDIGQVSCYGDDPSSGSGSLRYVSGLSGVFVLTNQHVITSNNCSVSFEDPEHPGSVRGIYQLDTSDLRRWNSKADIVVLKILYPKTDLSDPVSSLYPTTAILPLCDSPMSKGSPVVVVGYPAFAKKTIEVFGSTGTKWFQAATEGTISAYDDSVQWPPESLPEVNYFVSAKIDSGNSGGLAFSKNENGLCILGVPTWLSLGVYETQGLVQNIHNVFYVE